MIWVHNKTMGFLRKKALAKDRASLLRKRKKGMKSNFSAEE